MIVTRSSLILRSTSFKLFPLSPSIKILDPLYFTKDCIEANIGIEWDDENKCVKSEIEANMKDDTQDADLIGLDQALTYVSKANATTQPEWCACLCISSDSLNPSLLTFNTTGKNLILAIIIFIVMSRFICMMTIQSSSSFFFAW